MHVTISLKHMDQQSRINSLFIIDKRYHYRIVEISRLCHSDGPQLLLSPRNHLERNYHFNNRTLNRT